MPKKYKDAAKLAVSGTIKSLTTRENVLLKREKLLNSFSARQAMADCVNSITDKAEH
jgi:hypothetical protein